MGVGILQDCKIYLDQYNLSGDHNKLAVDYEADEKETTRFGNGTHALMGGLKNCGFAGAGLWQAGADSVDEVLFGQIGSSNGLLTVSGQTGADGDIAYFLKVMAAKYSTLGAIGDVNPFDFEAKNAPGSDLVRGTIMHNATRTATGTGVIRQLGAVPATARLVAGLHVFKPVSGTTPTLDVTVKSAALVGFGGPTTRITFTQMTTFGSQYKVLGPGAITDQFYRVDWAIGGTATPTFPFLVTVGILL